MKVEVAYALADRQTVVPIDVPPGTTVADAIEASGIRSQFPDMVIDPDRLGIFGRKVAPDRKLREGDRVEIYRPLEADPKEVRRARAKAQGS